MSFSSYGEGLYDGAPYVDEPFEGAQAAAGSFGWGRSALPCEAICSAAAQSRALACLGIADQEKAPELADFKKFPWCMKKEADYYQSCVSVCRESTGM